MKFLPLIWRSLCRRKLRTIFTFLSILVAFLLFGYLAAIRKAFDMGVDLAGADRLVLIHKVSLIQPLPLSYAERIRSVPGVAEATHASWFGGVYQDPKNFFAQMAVEPEGLLRLYPEYVLPPEQRKAWIETRTGALAGRTIAEKYGWKVGDRIPIQATIWRKKGGSTAWEFDLVGIYDGAAKGTDTTQFFFHYDYFDEARAFGQGLVGWYTIRVTDPDHAAETAERIDATFANSQYETRTSTEKAFVQAFANQVGNIGAIMVAVLAAVFFTILLVAGNTMAQSVRERTSELAVLKTLGFSDGKVLGLVLAESLALSGLAGLAGLALAWALIRRGDPTGGFLPIFFFPAADVARGAALALLMGLATGILPALRAMRLGIVDALRRS